MSYIIIYLTKNVSFNYPKFKYNVLNKLIMEPGFLFKYFFI